ncbi:MAG: DNA-directed RNA polymerase subunit omega [Thermoleophilia bacterium]|jgi:DNA-directed RNA polymerase subunit K/omega
MLYGRHLDQSLQHVDGSRYALVHAVAKRARQITLWLTADPAELKAESTPPPAPGELTSRDPVALAEAEILEGAVTVRWDPEGRADLERELLEIEALEDPLLVEGLVDEDELETDEGDAGMTPALAQVLEGAVEEEAGTETGAETETEEESAVPAASAEEDLTVSRTRVVDGEEIEEISLEDVEEPDEDDDEDEVL